MIIAIDGPAASGKGTLGKRLAQHYGYRHLDTGVIYRAVAKALLDAGAELTDEARAVAAAMELDPEKFGDPALKTPESRRGGLGGLGHPQGAGGAGQFPAAVRRRPAGRGAGWPRHRNRDLPGCRCEDFRRRRPQSPGPPPHPGGQGAGRGRPTRPLVLADILKRDERDQNRAAAPLKAAPDAYLLDNSHLDIEGGVRAAIDIIEAVRAGRQRV